MGNDNKNEGEDLVSVESCDESLLRQEFEDILKMNDYQVIKGQTKIEPIEGENEELSEQLILENVKKGQAFEPEENFDEMMVDEGVSASNMR